MANESPAVFTIRIKGTKAAGAFTRALIDGCRDFDVEMLPRVQHRRRPTTRGGGSCSRGATYTPTRSIAASRT